MEKPRGWTGRVAKIEKEKKNRGKGKDKKKHYPPLGSTVWGEKKTSATSEPSQLQWQQAEDT